MTFKNRTIFFVFLIALIIRLLSLVTFNFIDSGGGSDSVTYLLLADNLFNGKGFTEYGIPHTIHHPFYPVMIGLFREVNGGLLFSAQLVAVLAGAFLVFPVFYLGRYLFNSRAGFYAALITAIFPVLVYGSTEPFSESLYTLCLLSGISVFWISFKRKSMMFMFPAGILIGLAFLTHPAGLVFLPLLFLDLLLFQFSSRKIRWRRLVGWAVVLAAGFVLTCLPFWLHLHRVTGGWQLSGRSHYQDLSLRLDQARGVPESQVVFEHMEILFNPEVNPPESDGPGLFRFAFRYPGKFMEIVKFNLEDGCQEVEKTAGMLGIPVWLLVVALAVFLLILGFSLFSGPGGNRLPAVFLLTLFLPTLAFVIVTIEHRYFYPFIPLGIIVLGCLLAGWEELVNLSGRNWLKTLFWIFIGLFFLIQLAGSAGVIYRKWKKIGVPYEYKLMGEWMKEEIDHIDRERVMMPRLGVSYYAGCKWNVLYWGESLGLKDYLKDREIRYIILSDYDLRMIQPEMRYLLETDRLPEGFRLLREITYDGRKIRCLEFFPR